MRQNNRTNIRVSKYISRQKYKERQIDKYIKWSMESKGYIRWGDLIEIQNKFEIAVNG